MRQILRNRALSVLFFATALLAGCGETAGNTPEHPTTEQITAAETEMATAETETETAAPLVTTETTSASTSAETATALEDDPFRSIAGEWYLDGDPDTAHLSIQSTGTFTAYYATGNVENTGYIQYETEEIGGMLSHWYLLYTAHFIWDFGTTAVHTSWSFLLEMAPIPVTFVWTALAGLQMTDGG